MPSLCSRTLKSLSSESTPFPWRAWRASRSGLSKFLLSFFLWVAIVSPHGRGNSQYNISFYERPDSLQWKRVMKSIKDDPQGFFEQGGWQDILQPPSSEEEDPAELEDEDFSDDFGEAEEEGEDVSQPSLDLAKGLTARILVPGVDVGR